MAVANIAYGNYKHNIYQDVTQGNHNNTDGTGKNSLVLTGVGGRKTMVCQDALYAVGSAVTGESVNVYKAEGYSKENPIYLIKGVDANGTEYEQTVDASKVDPSNCSFIELLALHVQAGNTSDSSFLGMAVIRDKAGCNSFFDKANYLSSAIAAMEEQRILRNWDGYLRYSEWIESITNGKEQSDKKQSLFAAAKEKRTEHGIMMLGSNSLSFRHKNGEEGWRFMFHEDDYDSVKNEWDKKSDQELSEDKEFWKENFDEQSVRYIEREMDSSSQLLNETIGKDTKTESDIIVKPDGSRVLVMTIKIGGMSSQMSIELSKPTDRLKEEGSNREMMQKEEKSDNTEVENGLDGTVIDEGGSINGYI